MDVDRNSARARGQAQGSPPGWRPMPKGPPAGCPVWALCLASQLPPPSPWCRTHPRPGSSIACAVRGHGRERCLQSRIIARAALARALDLINARSRTCLCMALSLLPCLCSAHCQIDPGTDHTAISTLQLWCCETSTHRRHGPQGQTRRPLARDDRP